MPGAVKPRLFENAKKKKGAPGKRNGANEWNSEQDGREDGVWKCTKPKCREEPGNCEQSAVYYAQE